MVCLCQDTSKMEDVAINITTWANHKPWMTAEVRAMLKALNVTFKSGDRVALKTARTNSGL